MKGNTTFANDSDYFLTRVFAVWVNSVTTCFSHDANKLCLPVALTILSALLILLSCILVVYQRCKFRGESSGETLVVFYCFLGNLCSTVGAIMSRQMHILVFMSAFTAATDAVNCILCCFPVLLCWNSKAQRRLRMMKRRRRQHLLAVGVLMVVAGGFLKSRVDDPAAFRPAKGRKLLHVPLQTSVWSPTMDNGEILGYALGLLSFLISCTSRFPAFCRARRGQKLARVYFFSGLLCSLSGAVYTAAILLYDTELWFLLRVMPWLLSSVGCTALDLLILCIYLWKRGAKQQLMKFSHDSESLLCASGAHTDDTTVVKPQKKQQTPSSAQTKYSTFTSKAKTVQKMTEMGHYMDVSVHPTRKHMSLKEVTLSKEGLEDGLLCKKVRVIRVDSLCSSDTSYDSSPVSSDLEWDFGVAISQWSKPAAKPQEGDEFPLQDWPTNPKPFNICTCSTSEPSQKILHAAEEGSSIITGPHPVFLLSSWVIRAGLGKETAEKISSLLDGQGLAHPLHHSADLCLLAPRL